jgi:hypothetical protein
VQQDQGRRVGRADVADEDRAAFRELDLVTVRQPRLVGGGGREREVRVGALERPAQIDSTLMTVTVSAPFGAS